MSHITRRGFVAVAAAAAGPDRIRPERQPSEKGASNNRSLKRFLTPKCLSKRCAVIAPRSEFRVWT